MSCIYAIPFGQADCFIIELEDNDKKKYVLLDGGTKKNQGNKLEKFLGDNNISIINLMVITHMHQDHIGYIPEITGWKRRIAGKCGTDGVHTELALLPFRAEFLQGIMLDNAEMREDYLNLFRTAMNLKKQHTEIYYNNIIQKYHSFVIGDYRLTVIYPYRESMLALTENRSLINGDSSVLLLTKEKRQLALFCGDCFEENFSELYFQYVKDNNLEKNLELLKLSHHGRNDKGHIYYTEEFLKKIKPEKVIITSDEKNIKKYSCEWKRVLAGTDIYAIEDELVRIDI